MTLTDIEDDSRNALQLDGHCECAGAEAVVSKFASVRCDEL
jgi:hypothetical protein